MKAFPPELPGLSAERPYRPPEIFTSVLPNGLTVQVARQGRLPLVTLRLLVRGGLADDAADSPCFAEHLADSLEEGTTTRSGRDMFDLLQGVGGDLRADAGPDAIVVAAHGLASATPVLVGVLADVVRNPAFPRDGVARVKALAREDLETDESEPSFLAGRAFALAIYGLHPYGTVAPTSESIAAVTVRRLREEAKRRLRPERSLLLVVGDVDPGEVTRHVLDAFGGWAASGTGPGPIAEAPRTREGKLVVVDRPGSVQATFLVGCVGVTRRDPDAWPLDVAMTIYGGAFSSRLVQNLRVEKGYTYSTGAVSTWAACRGAVKTWASVRTDVGAAALTEILREMRRMGTEAVAVEELERGRRREAGLHLLSLQTASGLARELADLWLAGLAPEALGETMDALSRITAEDVRRVSHAYLDPDRATVVAVGDGRKLGEGLSSFDPATRSARQAGV